MNTIFSGSVLFWLGLFDWAVRSIESSCLRERERLIRCIIRQAWSFRSYDQIDYVFSSFCIFLSLSELFIATRCSRFYQHKHIWNGMWVCESVICWSNMQLLYSRWACTCWFVNVCVRVCRMAPKKWTISLRNEVEKRRKCAIASYSMISRSISVYTIE